MITVRVPWFTLYLVAAANVVFSVIDRHGHIGEESLARTERNRSATVWMGSDYSTSDTSCLLQQRTMTVVAARAGVYSKHDCHGSHANRTCRFRDVCYNLTSDLPMLLYFHNGSAKPEGQLPSRQWLGKAGRNSFRRLHVLQNDMDVPTSLDLRPASMKNVNGPVPMNIDLIPEHIPHQAVYFRNPVAVLFQPFGAENFGHQLADNMYAIYVMLRTFGIADSFNAQLLTLASCDSFSDDGMDRSICKKLMPKMYSALSRYPVLQLHMSDSLLADAVSTVQHHKGGLNTMPGEESSLMCFRTLLVSPGANSFRMWGHPSARPHFFWDFRLQLVRNVLGPSCADPACGSSVTVPMHILISVKSWKNRAKSKYSSGHGLENVDALREHLRAQFPKYRVESADLATMSFQDQISLLTQTAFLFSHGGGGSFGALFLPRMGTLAVAPSRAAASELSWMNTLWFFICRLPSTDVSLEDAVRIVRSEQPGCWKPLENPR